MEARWQRLCRTLERTAPFQTPEWLRAYIASFETQGVRIFEFLDEAQTVGIIPLIPATARRYFRQQNWIEFAASRYADYATFVCSPTDVDDIAKSLATDLPAMQWDGLYLGNFRSKDPFLKSLAPAMNSSGLHLRHRSASVVRMLARETYQTQSQSGARWSSDKLLKKLEKKGKLEFQVHKEFPAIAELLPQFFQMHRARFSSRGLHSMFEDPCQQRFFLELARAFSASRDVWLSVLSCEEKPVAMRFSLRGGDRLHLYSTCFDNDFGNFSPSSHQLRFLLEHAFQSGINVVDLGIGTSPHKELPGTEIGDELVILEAYRSRVGAMESAVFDSIQRLRMRSRFIEKLGQRVRKLLPHTA